MIAPTLDFITFLTAIGVGLGLVVSTYVLYLIVFVQGEDPHIPAMFCFGSTIISVVWFMGWRWDMDPAQFPQGFCKTSAILYNFGAFCMTSSGATLTMTTWNAVYQARRGRFSFICRPWQVPVALQIFFVCYPFVALALFAGLSLGLDAIGPEGRWICDVVRVDKLWVRLFGYGGLDVLVTVPAFIASLSSVYNLWAIHNDKSIAGDIQTYQRTHFGLTGASDDDQNFGMQRLRGDPEDLAQPVSSCIRITLDHPNAAESSTSPSVRHAPRLGYVRNDSDQGHSLSSRWQEETVGSNRRYSVRSSQRDSFAMSADRSPTLPSHSEHRIESRVLDELSFTDSMTDVIFPEKAVHRQESAIASPSSWYPSRPHTGTEEGLDGSPSLENKTWDASTQVPSRSVHSPEPQRRSQNDEAREPPSLKVASQHLQEGTKKERPKLLAIRHQPKLLHALWRIMFFDIVFTVIEVLAAITSLRAIATGIPPRGYDTAFAAVVIGLWGPTIVFGTTPLILNHVIGRKSFAR